MRTISYEDYFDKVYGCMIGKCVSGTAGAPYEGMKQQLNLQFTAEEADTTLPNDDLDLQVLWLDALEKKGIYLTADDLAQRFLHNCPYAPGEYAMFKQNYRRHIHPPYSGRYNNRYYFEGMGCPIRSEVWGCIAPGDPSLAAELCELDGTLDHYGNSVWAERFLAALEAEAFFESDISVLIQKALAYVPVESRFFTLVTDVVNWCAEYDSFDQIYRQILRRYGHPDCTNMFQNIGITLFALIKGDGELLKTTELAINGGYDTDCTGATVGAVVGLIMGAKELERRYGFSDQTYGLSVLTQRRSNKISDLAEDICRVGVHFAGKGRCSTTILGCPLPPLEPAEEIPPQLTITACYVGEPVVSPQRDGRATIVLVNYTDHPMEGKLIVESETLCPDTTETQLCLQPNASAEVAATFSLPTETKWVNDSNPVTVTFSGEITQSYCFGFAGGIPWMLYGPFWENNFTVEELTPGVSYMEQFPGKTADERADNLRDYHVSAFVDLKKEYLDLASLSKGETASGGEVVYTYEDRILMSDLMDYQGPCCIYLTRSFYSPVERTCRLDIGYSDAFCLWLNGEKLAQREDCVWWTAENVHLHKVNMKKGINHVAVRLCRRALESCFSFIFKEDSVSALGALSFPEHLTDLRNGVEG